MLTATLEDAAGNTVTSDDTTVDRLRARPPAPAPSPEPGNATVTDGVATKAVTGALVGSVNMEATAAGLTTGTLGAFTVVHGAADQIELTGAITNLTSGATRVLTATIKDAAGNTLTSDNSTVVDFDQASGLGTVTGTGTRHRHRRRRHQDDHRRTGRHRQHGGHLGRPDRRHARRFIVVHGAAADIVLTGATTNLTSGATRVLTATLKDAAGNTVTSDNSTVVAFTKASGAGTVTGTGNDTAVAGVATKTITGALVGSVTMEATAAGLTTGTLGAFTVVHGAAAQIALTGATTNLTSGATRVLTATIKDAAGNTVTSDNTTVVTFAKASGAGTVTGTGNDTAIAGVATKTITGVLAGAVTMEATAGGLTDRHARRLHRRPRRRHPDLADGLDRQPDLRRHPPADRDDPGRGRQHRHLRQHAPSSPSPRPPAPARHRHWQRHRRRRRRHEDDHRPARRLRDDGSDLRRPDHRHASARSPSSTAPPPTSSSPARPPTSPPAPPASSPRR